MKVNETQRLICEIVRGQCSFWENSNDITSPIHLCDIGEDCFTQLCDFMEDGERDLFENMLTDLYWFIRKFDDVKQ